MMPAFVRGSHSKPIGMTAKISSQAARAIRMRLLSRALPWLVTLIWLTGTLFAFWFFELRLPRLPWCGGAGL
jgi:hypothetical protein